MSSAMGPPPPRNPEPNPNPSTEPETPQDEPAPAPAPPAKASMGPPPPRNPNSENGEQHQQRAEESEPNSNSRDVIETPAPEHGARQRAEESEPNSNSRDVIEKPAPEHSARHSSVPYTIPPWNGPPCHNFYLEVLKDGSIIDRLDVYTKGAYMFGREKLCDFVLEHPTISRYHAVIQFKRSGEAYLYDCGSTHGTFVNKSQVEKRVYVDLHVGDVIRFGQSSRLYIFQGPTELMPAETDLKIIREAKIQEEMLDREASLRRARQEASLADGISWGMAEDAIEEEEDDVDEVTWQTYKGKLTEKQEKTRDKIVKRMEKIAHMKKEIEVIRAKDIPQGGLTQGQQTQIARNEQRITQIMEELENLEETLNDSIRESMGARAGKISGGKRKGAPEDDEDFLSDDDEFYDRTKKKPSIQKGGESQSVETADTLLDKRDAVMKEIEEKKELLSIEKNRIASENAVETDSGDALDTYMSGLSSRLVLDRTMQLEKELSALQSELDRIFYLLKIADPAGEAAKKRDLNVQTPKANKSETPAVVVPTAVVKKQPLVESKRNEASREPGNLSKHTEGTVDSPTESTKKPEVEKVASDKAEAEKVVYTAVKPQWLGAVETKEIKESQQVELPSTQEPDQFVDYKDRKRMLENVDDLQLKDHSDIETAGPGLIIRKPRQVEKPEGSESKAYDQSTSSSPGADLMAQDAVALLLKHARGFQGEDDESSETHEMPAGNQSSKDAKKPKRVLGPEKPSFLDRNSDYETWVPPEGQSGDGRTSLNDRYGY
ncbi:hypothetical protein SLA2020_346760 [Shorea laevis]